MNYFNDSLFTKTITIRKFTTAWLGSVIRVDVDDIYFRSYDTGFFGWIELKWDIYKLKKQWNCHWNILHVK